MTGGVSAAPSPTRRIGLRLGGLASLPVLAAFALTAVVAVLAGGRVSPEGIPAGEQPQQDVSTLAEREIPPLYLQLYEQAARRYGLDWAILAGIGKVECDHGRDPAPACTQAGAVNSAGAGGPMQFLASTWARYGVSVGHAGPPNRWSPADAIYAAANYLRAAGAPANYRAALFAYNHAGWYVEAVERWASRYSQPAGETDEESETNLEGADLRLGEESPTPVRFIAGEHAELLPGDGHLALVPAGVPSTVQAMVVAGNELQGLRYGPGGHPDPLGVNEEDCSSTLNYVLYRSGVRRLSEIIHDNPLAQNYVTWGAPGPGRWVTIYATDLPTPHVFIVIAGLRLDTSYAGTDEGPNRNEGGPRWRILPYIPTWAHWSVRHPPGL